jgi:hypothetical protein
MATKSTARAARIELRTENPPKPTKALIEAARRFKNR